MRLATGKDAMARKIPPLNALHAFEVAARHRSFSKAALELTVSPAAISRHVKFLEEYLGVRLFERKPSSLQLTPTGQAYARRLIEVFQEIGDATEQTRLVAGKQRLSLRAYTTFLLRWLLPRLPDFQAKHPHVEINITTGMDAPDFSRDGIDVAIRYGRGIWPGLHGHKIFGDALQPFCSAQYLNDAGGALALDAIARYTLLHHSRRPRDWPEWIAAAGGIDVDAPSHVHLDDLLLVYEAALRGMGIGITQQKYLSAGLAEGVIVCPFEPVLYRETGYYAVCPTGQAESPAVREFFDWLRTACENDAACLPRLDSKP